MKKKYSKKAIGLVENGYTIIKNPFTSKVLESIDNFLDKNLDSFNNNDPYDDFGLPHNVKNGIQFDIYQRYPIFRDFAACSEIGEVLKSVLGEHIFLYENSLVYSLNLKVQMFHGIKTSKIALMNLSNISLL